MKLTLDLTKSIYENASEYYEKAKELKKKKEGLEKAIEETEKEIAKAEKEAKEEEKKVKIKREKKWFEKFHHFYTSSERLVIGGGNAQQNDIIYKKYIEENDLFFHADIQGGAAVVLKDGLNASEQELNETAQFTASFSNAWKNANATVDVYCVKKDQLSKHAQGGFIGRGAFAITGERQWFKSTKLGLKIGIKEGTLLLLPEVSSIKLEQEVLIFPAKSGKTKGELVKSLSKRFNTHPDDVMNILPNGKSKLNL